MKNIDLCGFGNGLVDLLYKISDEELKKYNINKGEMTLVDAEQQAVLLKQLESHTVEMCSGGSAANTIIAFSGFGGVAAYFTMLGNDTLGNFYLEEFRDLGVELNSRQISDEPTGTCIVLITPDSERTMITCLGASAKYEPLDVSEEIISRSKWLYIEGYKFSEEQGKEAITKAIEFSKQHGTKVSVTFSDVFITELFRNDLEEIVKQSQLIFCNENEALSYTKTNNFDDAVKILLQQCPNIVVTKGSKGSFISWENKIYEIPANPVAALDSTGAGDMFAAGLLYGLICNNDIENGGKLASLAASKIVTQFGARLKDNPEEIKKIIFS